MTKEQKRALFRLSLIMFSLLCLVSWVHVGLLLAVFNPRGFWAFMGGSLLAAIPMFFALRWVK